MRNLYLLSLFLSVLFVLSGNVLPAQNTIPIISGQNFTPLIDEDASIEILLAWLDIDDPDPDTHTLEVIDEVGDDYTAAGNTVTPTPDFDQTLSVTVRVFDGFDYSSNFPFQVDITPINDPPVINGQLVALDVDEDNTLTLSPGDLDITDPDDTEFTLTVQPGSMYAENDDEFTPDLNYNGPLTVDVQINDGEANSNTFGVSVDINPINDAPLITGQAAALSVDEDNPITLSLADLTIEDPDNSSFDLSVLSGSNYSAVGNEVTPSPDFDQPLDVQVRVNDGAADSNIFGVAVDINPINDAPVITGQVSTLIVYEDNTRIVASSDLIIDDPDNSSFNVSVLPGSNYNESGDAFTPILNYNGPLDVQVRVNDGMEDSNDFGVDVDVNAVNDPPVITGQVSALSVDEDNTLVIAPSDLTITDPDNTTFTLSVLPGSDYTGSLDQVTPSLNYFGNLDVQVNVNDGTDNSNTFEVDVDVDPVNDAPIITGQPSTLSVDEDNTLTIAPSDLTIDDPDNSAFTLSILPGSNYTGSDDEVTPSLNYFGPLDVQVQVNDGSVDSNTFGVDVDVNSVNDVPVIIGQISALSVDEDNTLTILPSDLDIDDPDDTNFTVIVQPGSNYTNSGDQVVPDANYFGSLSPPAMVFDGEDNSNTLTLAVDVNPINDAPTIGSIGDVTIDEGSGTQDIPFSGITVGPVNESGQSLAVTSDNDNNALFSSVTVDYTSPNSGGTLHITPNPSAVGAANFTVAVEDDGGDVPPNVNENSTSFTFTINDVINPPAFDPIGDVAVDEDAGSQDIDITGVTSGDVGETASFAAVSSNPAVIPNPIIDYGGSGSTATLTYVPQANQFGVVEITVTITDNVDGLSFEDKFFITVNSVNDAPVAVNDSYAVNEDATLTVTAAAGVLDNDSDLEGSPLTASLVADVSNGSLTLNADGSFTYTPNANFNGGDSFTYQANDGGENSNVATVNITVNGVNDAPVAVNDSYAVNEDATLTVTAATGVLDNDSDLEGSPLTASLVSDVSNGSLTLNADGSFTYTPNANFNGGDSFTYQANDGGENSNVATVSITVNGVNDAPVAADDAYSVNENATLTVTSATGVLNNDSDLEGSPLTASLVADVSNGSLTLNANGSFTYTPSPGYTGGDSFTYQANDGGENSNVATVSITVTNVNDAPIAVDDSYGVNEDATLTVAAAAGVLDNDTDADGDPLTASLVDDVSNGSLTLNADGSFTYTPNANYNGGDSFTYRANDGTVNSGVATVSITVNAVNDPPTLDPLGDVIVSEDALQQTINLTGISAGPGENQPPIQVSASTDKPELFSVFGVVYTSPQTTGVLNIQPNANVTGSATVTVTVTDNGNPDLSFSQMFMFVINEENDPPTFNAISNPVNINEDAASQNINITGISGGPGESSQQVTVTATSDDTNIIPNPVVVYDGFSGTATLSFQPEANRNGSVIITVRAVDEESAEFTRTFTVNVQAINDAPTLDAMGNTSIAEDAPETAIDLTGIGAGPFEGSQNLTVTATTTQPGYFDVFAVDYVTPQSTGTLRIQPKANVSGTASITVRVQDNGSNVAPNINFITRSFDLTINAENDAPVITGQATVSTNEDQSFTIQLSHLTIQDPDNSSGFTLSVGSGPNYQVSGNTVTPDPNFYGTLNIPVTVSDGNASSPTFNFVLTVSPVNDAPVIYGQNPVSVDEAQPFDLNLGMLLVEDHDPEDVYPDDYTLFVLSGANYSVAGYTVTPVANFSGVLNIPVFVNDGTANSNTFTLQVSVASVNDPPTITGQTATININEDQSTTLSLSQLSITDPDNDPADFTLTILPNTNYTFSGLTVTPNQNFYGTLSVNVTVSDGELNSAPFAMQINVAPVNDVPTITGQNAVTTAEDTPVTLKLGDLIVADVDDHDPYPGTFTMSASSGENYTVSGLVVTPAQNYSGVLSVPVTVNDGDANSNTFNLQIQVTPVNDAPVINGQTPNPLTTTEDIPITVEFSNLQVTDVDTPGYPTGFSIVIQSGTNYTFSGTTVTPTLDFVGALSVNVRVSDGNALSQPFALQILVGDENDPPVITGQQAVSVDEDQSVTILISHLTINDPDSENHTLTVLAGTNYTVSGATVIPSPNFFGNLSVGVRVNDGFNNSPVYNMTVQVKPVNDPPSFDPISDVVLAENAPATNVSITSISPGPLESQVLLASATSSNTDIMDDPTFVPAYNGTATSATLRIQPKANKTGNVVVTVKFVDPGLLEFTRTFNVSISTINDPPTLDPITYGPILEDAPLQSINLTGITAGPQESQALTVTVTTNKPELFDPQPNITYTSPQSTGKLNIKPKANAFGSASITVKVEDEGPNVAPHKNFIERTFTLVITPVNDAPVFTSTPDMTAAIGELYEYMIDVTDADPGDVITITAVEKPAWLTLTPQGNGKALLSGTPPANAVGAVSVKLQAKDTGNATTPQDYTLQINTRPVVSDFAITLNEDELKTIGLASFTGAFSDVDNDELQKIQIVKLPGKGQLLLNAQAVTLDQEIDASAIANLAYRPQQDFNGKDTVEWKGADAQNYSTNKARILFTINPINDPPVIVKLEQQILEFSVGEGPGIISTEFEVVDVDSETLTGAEIGFRRQNFVPQIDLLHFNNTPKIQGSYDAASGILTLTGTATVAEYNEAIRTITYDNISEVFAQEEIIKTIGYTVNDGLALSDTRDRQIKLIDLFEELVIPNGFTPGNNDQANDTWFIINIERYTEAVVKVYNMRGQEVYSSEGSYEEWDGTYGGRLLPSDTYYYTIDLKLPFRKKVYKGAVTILR